MSILGFICIAFTAMALAVQMASNGMAVFNCRRRLQRHVPRSRPPVTIVRPLSGLEQFSLETLASTFSINYPGYEILFCVAQASDPVLPLVRRLVAEHPQKEAHILVGEDAFSANPKLNNIAKGFRHARYEHIVFVDSNVLIPPDYLDQLICRLEDQVGMVTAPPVGYAPLGFWAEVECAFLNSYQARIQYAVDMMGCGFAQGKTLFFRRHDLDNGGFSQLAEEPAEDAAATKMMRARGQRIRLAGPFPQLIGMRSSREVWNRQVRWARLRRTSFPWLFAPEVLAGLLPPLASLVAGLSCLGITSPLAIVLFPAAWYAPELFLLRLSGWPRSLTAMLLRDVMLPLVFVAGCVSSRVEWHGKQIMLDPARKAAPAASLLRKLSLVRLASRGPGV